MIYKSKPVEIEAIEWTGANFPEIKHFCETAWLKYGSDLTIPTLEGEMKANIGDFIIKGLAGEFYPCKPEIFKKKYELL